MKNKRLKADLVDACCILLLTADVTILLSRWPLPAVEAANGWLLWLAAGFISFLVSSFAYFIPANVWFQGRSLGKWLLGLRIKAEDGGPVGVGTSYLRAIFQFGALVLFPIALYCVLYKEGKMVYDALLGIKVEQI